MGACETDGSGRSSEEERDTITLSEQRARGDQRRGTWGGLVRTAREGYTPGSGVVYPWSTRRAAANQARLEGMPGVGLTSGARGQARSEMLALKPYWGKPTVRNFREGDGDVGIMRSPVRAIALPDLGLQFRSGTIKDKVRTQDIGPTILDFFAVPSPKEHEGKTVLSLLREA